MTWFNVLSIKLNCRDDVDRAWTEFPGEKWSACPSGFPGRCPAVMDMDQLGTGLGRMGEVQGMAFPQPVTAITFPSRRKIAASRVVWALRQPPSSHVVTWEEWSRNENLPCYWDKVFESTWNGCPLSYVICLGVLQEFCRKLANGKLLSIVG